MYSPKHFEISDQTQAYDFVQKHSFGQLISREAGRLFSSHLPLMLSEDKTKLIGHMAKQNPQLESLEAQEIMISFEGAHGYISPSWYQSQGVPTWNYQAVHIYGQCQLITDPNELKKIVDSLTHKYESQFTHPWQPDYNDKLINAIIGFEVQITEIQSKFKLSQNRSVEDQQQVIQQLKEQGNDALAQAMLKSLSD